MKGCVFMKIRQFYRDLMKLLSDEWFRKQCINNKAKFIVIYWLPRYCPILKRYLIWEAKRYFKKQTKKESES